MRQILLFILLLTPVICNSKPSNQKEIEKINKRALRWFKKTDCYVPGNYEMINLLNVDYKGNYHDRNEVGNRLEELIEPFYPHYDRRYWCNMTYICNEEGRIVASTEYRNLYCTSHYNEVAFESEQQLVDLLREKGIHIAYCFFTFAPLRCLGIDNNNVIYVFREVEGVYKAKKIEEMSDEEWDQLFSHIFTIGGWGD